MAYQKNNIVNFSRTGISKVGIKIEAVVVIKDNPKTYIIEHEKGWLPDPIRLNKFGLNPTKKYLFVSESELTV